MAIPLSTQKREYEDDEFEDEVWSRFDEKQFHRTPDGAKSVGHQSTTGCSPRLTFAPTHNERAAKAPAQARNEGTGTTARRRIAASRRSPVSRSALLRTAWLAGWLALAGTFLGWGLYDSDDSRAVPSLCAAASQPPASSVIESIRVGDRVMAEHSNGESCGHTEVDPAGWRLLKLRAEVGSVEAGVDDINVDTLQPPEWVARYRAEVGAEVPLPLDLVDMGLPAELKATVLANDDCPPIESGRGRVVLTTINHLNHDVYKLIIESRDGRTETIRPTGLHKFYRPSDGAWVSTKKLRPGDELAGIAGPIVVRRLAKVPGVHRVYNMTVEGEHVYRVSLLGALVHNNDCAAPVPDPRRRPGYDPGEFHEDHAVAKAFGGTDTRPFPNASNLRKGGLEGALRKYENYLNEIWKRPDLAREVIQPEIESLSRDVIASPFSNVFPPGFRPEHLDQ